LKFWPLKTAVTLTLPLVGNGILTDATPPEVSTVCPNELVEKETDPSGTIPVLEVTVAVYVTELPAGDGLWEDDNVTVTGASATVTFLTPTLPPNWALPL
jgi:hypothetical protein